MLLAPICTIDSKLECDAHIVLEMFDASLGEQFSNSDGGKLSSSRNKYANRKHDQIQECWILFPLFP